MAAMSFLSDWRPPARRGASGPKKRYCNRSLRFNVAPHISMRSLETYGFKLTEKHRKTHGFFAQGVLGKILFKDTQEIFLGQVVWLIIE